MEAPKTYSFTVVDDKGGPAFRLLREPRFPYAVVDSIKEPNYDPSLFFKDNRPTVGGLVGLDVFLQSGFDVDKNGNVFPIDWKNLGQWYRFTTSFQEKIKGQWYFVGKPWLPSKVVTKRRQLAFNETLDEFLNNLDTKDI